MADNEDKKNQRKTSDPTVDFGPRAKRTDPELAWLDSVMKRERMDAKGVRRDFNGIPIEPDAPQGLDWIRAHGPDSEAAQRNRHVMAVEQQQLNNDRLTAGRSAVEAMKMLREMQTPSVQTDAYGRKVATQNGIPVGYSTTPSMPQFEAPKLPTYAGENPTTQRANINAGGATNAARLALRSNIEQVGAGFRPASAMKPSAPIMPYESPSVDNLAWVTGQVPKPQGPMFDLLGQTSPQVPQTSQVPWTQSPEVQKAGLVPTLIQGGDTMLQQLLAKLFGQNAGQQYKDLGQFMNELQAWLNGGNVFDGLPQEPPASAWPTASQAPTTQTTTPNSQPSMLTSWLMNLAKTMH